MKGWIFPGRIISCAGAAAFGWAIETEGIAICAVTVRKLASALRRDRIPKNKTANTTTLKVTGMTQRCCDGRPLYGFGSNGTIST
jgi:TRAP-type mannitol/chloroaromatic compound transport system permease large subunit